MNHKRFPKARPDCLSRTLKAEVVIYDPQRHVGHCLNSTAAAVWKLCNGQNSPSDIAAVLSRRGAQIEEGVVQLTLQRLREVHLLVEPTVHRSRRVVLRKLGITAAVALPLITSIVAPMPANAVTCLHDLQPCANDSQCCSGICAPVVHRCVGG
jgi:hypothetical protein